MIKKEKKGRKKKHETRKLRKSTFASVRSCSSVYAEYPLRVVSFDANENRVNKVCRYKRKTMYAYDDQCNVTYFYSYLIRQ